MPEKLRNPMTVASESEFLKTLDVTQNNIHEILHILDNDQKYLFLSFLGLNIKMQTKAILSQKYVN